MNAQLDGKIYLQKLQTVAYLCLGVPLIFFIYLYLESSVDHLDEIIPSNYHLVLLIPILLICLIIIFWGRKKFTLAIEQAQSKSDLKEKLNLYRLANNYRFIIYGLSALLITFGFYLTNYQPFAALFGIMIVLFSINNPSTKKIVSDLNLKKSEKDIILKGLDIP